MTKEIRTLILRLGLSICLSSSLFLPAISMAKSKRKTASTSTLIEFSKKNQPCTVTSDCEAGLLCRQQICRLPGLAEAGESCFQNQDCKSYSCSPAKSCNPAKDSLLPNGASCFLQSQCHSNTCFEGQCLASSTLPGLPYQKAFRPQNCLSQFSKSNSISAFKVCDYGGSFAASCAPIGERVNTAIQCCSKTGFKKSKSETLCIGINDEHCSKDGLCQARVGKTCADVGQKVNHAFQCCSQSAHNNVCILNYSKSFFPCAKDSSCPSGQRCDTSNNLCQH